MKTRMMFWLWYEMIVLTWTMTFVANFQSVYGQSACPCITTVSSKRPLELDCSGLGLMNINEISSCGDLSPFGRLNFSHNTLTQFSLGDFLSLNRELNTLIPELVLDISYNQIAVVDTFAGIPRFGKLVLNMSNNIIESLDDTTFLHIGLADHYEIDVSYNNLKKVRIVERTEQNRVAIFLLGNNKITAVSIEILSFIAKNVSVDLQNNSIKMLNENQTRDWQNVIYSLNLKGNPWNCDCLQRFIANENSSLRILLGLHESVGPLCQEPLHVKGRTLLSLSQNEFGCFTVLNPRVGERVEIVCPNTSGDVNWMIYLGNDLIKSSLSVRTNQPLVIESMDTEWEGRYTCTNSNGAQHEIEVLLYPSSTSPTVDDQTTPPTRQEELGQKGGNPLPALVVLSMLVIIVSAALVITCVMYYRASKQRGTASVNEIRQPSTSKLNVTKPESVVNVKKVGPAGHQENDNEGIYQNDSKHRANEGKGNFGPPRYERNLPREIQAGASSARYYNISGRGHEETKDSQLDYEFIDDHDDRYLALNINERNQSRGTYQPIIKH
ncbi:SLIT and NTRK-like protein 5 [Apostichopus japonicus]|uniref:SLIT and NTRK-like protein 5 n=1 Tax=Stichopus japonicus TaxID=307972 RepID=A0A2G8LDB3_STIJA|nr:SLIT and NTRK-like protein 5 [Apostichopus japonicus]